MVGVAWIGGTKGVCSGVLPASDTFPLLFPAAVRRFLLSLLSRVVYPTLRLTPSRAPGLSPLPWPGPAGEVNVAVVDLDGALVDVIQCRTPADLMRLMAEHDPGAPVPRRFRRVLRPAPAV